MKKIVIIIAVVSLAIACKKENTVPDINVEGYWNVLRDTTFTVSAANATADLFHLFRGEHAFYRLSFLKTHDFTNLTLRPRNDSLISYFQVSGNKLMIPNPAPSFTNIVPENVLLSKTESEMIFTRYVVERRSNLDGKILNARTDTIRYIKVTDAAKIAYFNNYLKTYHP
jgi:hypothetical protein